MTNRIFLVGYMGSGKTTIGKLVAEKAGMQFVDLDYFIENRHRKTIGHIFAEKGEDVFREIESKALREVATFENVIISTGGGAPCFHNNMELMNKTGTTVYIKVSVEELANRLDSCKQNRPLLKDKNSMELREFITLSLEKRELFYNKASLVFDAEKQFSQTDVNHIVTNLIHHLSIVIVTP